jgi:hypothetical protein
MIQELKEELRIFLFVLKSFYNVMSFLQSTSYDKKSLLYSQGQKFYRHVFHVIMCVNYRLIITSSSCVLMSESVPEGARFF